MYIVILFNGHNIKTLGLLVMAFSSPAVEMKKNSKLYNKESFNLAKNSFLVVLGKYKPNQILLGRRSISSYLVFQSIKSRYE